MTKGQAFALFIAAICIGFAAFVVLGESRYRLDSKAYAIPRSYAFRLGLPQWAMGSGMPEDSSVALSFPESEIASVAPPYQPRSGGFLGLGGSTLKVRVFAGVAARQAWQQAKDRAADATQRLMLDPVTQFDRAYLQGGSSDSRLFFLVGAPARSLSTDWRPPMCLMQRGDPRSAPFQCSVTVRRNGLVMKIMLDDANVTAADHIADYVLVSLKAWEDDKP